MTQPEMPDLSRKGVAEGIGDVCSCVCVCVCVCARMCLCCRSSESREPGSCEGNNESEVCLSVIMK